MSTTYLIIVIASWIVWLGFAALTSRTITRLCRELRAAREEADDYRNALELHERIARLKAVHAALYEFGRNLCVELMVKKSLRGCYPRASVANL